VDFQQECYLFFFNFAMFFFPSACCPLSLSMVITGYIHLHMSKANTWGVFSVSYTKLSAAGLDFITERKETHY